MPADIERILDDLRAEQEDLDRIVAPQPPERWDTPTPAEGWSVRDQIGHLAFFDERATLVSPTPRASPASSPSCSRTRSGS